MKKRTSVYIDAELLEFAKKEKLNLSKLLEEAIKSVKNGNKASERVTCNHQVPGSNPGGGLAKSKNFNFNLCTKIDIIV